MLIKDQSAINSMRKGGKILAEILKQTSSRIREGMTTMEIDIIVNRLCFKHNVIPAFKGYMPLGSKEGYPASVCISVNEEIVHGLPSKRKLYRGDIVSLDFGVLYEGYITDAALTIAVGEITEEDEELINTTKLALYKAIDVVREGVRVGDISWTIQNCVSKKGFNVFKSLAGHGVGKELHEEPTIPNFGLKGTGDILKEGMTLAIEVMATRGKGELKTAPDGWTLKTSDNERAAQFEHTILVTKEGFEILTESE